MSKIALEGNASGTGTFTLASPNSSTDRTLTLPDNTGTIITTASTFAGTGPAFLVRADGTSLASATWTKIELDIETYDTANCFDSTTNYRFTPNVAGYYQISGVISIVGTNAATLNILAFYKNGSGFVRGSRGANLAGQGIALSGSVLIYLNGTTDYVELYGYSGAANSLETDPIGFSFMSGTLVRAA